MRKLAVFGAGAATLAVGALLAATSAGGVSRSTTIHLFEHDTSQANIDLGAPGDSAGDQFVFGGDTYTRKGGRKVGRAGGTCTTTSTGAAGEVLCVVTMTLPAGQLSSQSLFVASQLFSGRTLRFPITGGTGRYRHARGDGTVQIPPDVPGMTDANFVLRLR
jgi:hypothetical protein